MSSQNALNTKMLSEMQGLFAPSLDPVREYHDEPRLEYHVVAHVHVLAGHDGDRLPPRDAPAHVLLVLPPVHLTRLQRQKPCKINTVTSYHACKSC